MSRQWSFSSQKQLGIYFHLPPSLKMFFKMEIYKNMKGYSADILMTGKSISIHMS